MTNTHAGYTQVSRITCFFFKGIPPVLFTFVKHSTHLWLWFVFSLPIYLALNPPTLGLPSSLIYLFAVCFDSLRKKIQDRNTHTFTLFFFFLEISFQNFWLGFCQNIFCSFLWNIQFLFARLAQKPKKKSCSCWSTWFIRTIFEKFSKTNRFWTVTCDLLGTLKLWQLWTLNTEILEAEGLRTEPHESLLTNDFESAFRQDNKLLCPYQDC